MPASSTQYSRPSQAQVTRPRPDVSLMRDKNGCITCRVRQKKCGGIVSGQKDCNDCQRLNIQCLGVQHNRPDWLRNPIALKETKHRIKHHLTEYPVPRGRGPAPERPYLDFRDLIEKYSPVVPMQGVAVTPTEEFQNLDLISQRLYRMEPDSPTHTNGYLKVQSSSQTPATPSPSSSYAPMPLTPTSSDGGLFVSPNLHACYSSGSAPQGTFVDQTAAPIYHEMPYLSQLETMYHNEMASVSPTNPYRVGYSQDLFLTSPISPYSNEYLPEDYISPSARRR